MKFNHHHVHDIFDAFCFFFFPPHTHSPFILYMQSSVNDYLAFGTDKGQILVFSLVQGQLLTSLGSSSSSSSSGGGVSQKGVCGCVCV